MSDNLDTLLTVLQQLWKRREEVERDIGSVMRSIELTRADLPAAVGAVNVDEPPIVDVLNFEKIYPREIQEIAKAAIEKKRRPLTRSEVLAEIYKLKKRPGGKTEADRNGRTSWALWATSDLINLEKLARKRGIARAGFWIKDRPYEPLGYEPGIEDLISGNEPVPKNGRGRNSKRRR
jgi:hypothetical protein